MCFSFSIHLIILSIDVNAILTYGIIAGILFAIVIIMVMGIKWKWFKHRLTFEQIPSTTNNLDQHEPKIIKASFRQSCDFDNVVNITPIKTLPRKWFNISLYIKSCN